MNIEEQFENDSNVSIESQAQDTDFTEITKHWLNKATQHKYSYNFYALGRPIIQYPQDIVALQEIIWKVKPDLIIETGIAHGGSLILNASMIALLDICDAIENSQSLNPKISNRKVLGIDIDIREHNKKAIEEHPLSSRIEMIEGSSIDPVIIEQARNFSKKFNRVLVLLDSNHTHSHVLEELKAYAELVSVGSYCIVFDTLIQDRDVNAYPDRPWGVGDNPKTAVWDFLGSNSDFEIDKNIQDKLLITVAPDGFLKRIH